VTNVLDAEAQAQHAEQIADDIEALENTKAPLWAVYGPGGTFEHHRKNLLSAIAERIRLEAREQGQQVGGRGGLTDGQVDDRAHADLEYGARIDLATTERTQLALLDAEINKNIRLYELAQGRMNTARKLIRFDGSNGA
jgi:hypothetical protein